MLYKCFATFEVHYSSTLYLLSMKKLLLLSFCLFFAACGFAQTTYLADTAFTTDIGFGGAGASCVAQHGFYFGWQMGRATDAWVADVFTVPSGATWTFDTVIVYGYQTNSGTTSTFLNCNLQIYQGTPGLGGTVVWGDTSTNVLSSTGFTGIYRVDTVTAHGGLLGAGRPIMYLKLYLATPPHLAAGTYWLSWSTAGSLTANSCPPKVLPGRLSPTGQSGRQLVGGNWNYVLDSSVEMGFNKIIKASAALTSGVAQVQGSAAATLQQNVPNPFRSTTSITFNMPEAGNLRLSVYNMAGQLVATPFDGWAGSGLHQVAFSASGLPAGIYCYRLSGTATAESRQMIVAD